MILQKSEFSYRGNVVICRICKQDVELYNGGVSNIGFQYLT